MTAEESGEGGATLDAARLAAWIGRERRTRGRLDVARARLFEATLDLVPSLAEGDALPPLWHWLYPHEGTPSGALGEDGHARRGDFLPPVALPRRMWAGGRLEFVEPLPLGAEVERLSRVAALSRRRGRSGELCFVTVEHRLSRAGRLALVEEHDIVYREAPRPQPERQARPATPCAAAPPLVELGPARWRVTPSIALLFRYSALTFNAHRIHFDREYCREVEGYPGLIVHGPLVATLLARLAERGAGAPLLRFAFRALAPLDDTAAFEIALAGQGDGGALELVATRADGQSAMRATAIPAARDR